MGDGKAGPDPEHPARVELGEFFLQEGVLPGRWTFGRGKESLVTGLSAEQAFQIVVRLRARTLR
jgi:hypothetical protein